MEFVWNAEMSGTDPSIRDPSERRKIQNRIAQRKFSTLIEHPLRPSTNSEQETRSASNGRVSPRTPPRLCDHGSLTRHRLRAQRRESTIRCRLILNPRARRRFRRRRRRSPMGKHLASTRDHDRSGERAELARNFNLRGSISSRGQFEVRSYPPG